MYWHKSNVELWNLDKTLDSVCFMLSLIFSPARGLKKQLMLFRCPPIIFFCSKRPFFRLENCKNRKICTAHWLLSFNYRSTSQPHHHENPLLWNSHPHFFEALYSKVAVIFFFCDCFHKKCCFFDGNHQMTFRKLCVGTKMTIWYCFFFQVWWILSCKFDVTHRKTHTLKKCSSFFQVTIYFTSKDSTSIQNCTSILRTQRALWVLLAVRVSTRYWLSKHTFFDMAYIFRSFPYTLCGLPPYIEPAKRKSGVEEKREKATTVVT